MKVFQVVIFIVYDWSVVQEAWMEPASKIDHVIVCEGIDEARKLAAAWEAASPYNPAKETNEKVYSRKQFVAMVCQSK